MGVRIFQLAKELDMPSKDLVAYLRTQGLKVTSHMSAVEDTVARILRDRLPKKVQAQKAQKEAEEKKKRDKGLLEKGLKPGARSGAPGEAAAASRSGSGGQPPGRPGALPAKGLVGSAKGSNGGSTAALEKKGFRPGGKEPAKGSPGAAGAPAAVLPGKAKAGTPSPPGEALEEPKEGFEEPEVEEDEVVEKRLKERDAKPGRKRFFPGVGDYDDEGAAKHFAGVKRVKRKEVGSSSSTSISISISTSTSIAVSEAPAVMPVEAILQLPVTIKEFSAKVGIKVPDIMKFLMKKGLMPSMNSYLEETMVQELGSEFKVAIKIQKEENLEDAIATLENFKSPLEALIPRAPVVTFLGHVDHGKTSLLDMIRKTKVTAKEIGGITQHLGAYRVDQRNIHVVFIDTPGHKAFTEMRARGANVTDVAVLVVAADEGPMPQTEEALSHANAAGVPIVVALNKIDKSTANPSLCRDKLSKLGLIPVEWGGKTEYIEVSAITGQGIDNLLETLSLESQILDLKADPSRPAIGVVLEAESHPGRGNLATVLVQNGTLRVGDYALCGIAHGRVRNLWLNADLPLKEAGPANPVQISGLSPLPEVGDKLYIFAEAQKARQIAEERQRRKREEERARVQKLSLENLWQQLEKSEVKELRLVIKADVKGSLEALKRSIQEIKTDEVSIKIIHDGVGGVSQEDILLADASKAIVLGFNVGIDERAQAYAEEKSVEIRRYQIIYDLIEDIKRALEDRLAPHVREQIQGRIEIRKVYRASKIGNIAGCYVKKGSVFRDSKVRLLRSGIVIHTGTIESLKRHKDDAREVKEGFECGIKIAGFDNIEEGDLLEAFTIVEEKRNL